MSAWSLSKVLFFLFIFGICHASVLSAQGKGNKEEGSEAPGNDACKKTESNDKIKNDMSPFRYDKTTTTRIFYKAYDQIVNVAIPVFYKTSYKVIVNTEGMPTAVKVRITDRPSGMSTAKILKESESKHFVWEPDAGFEGDRVYIQYLIPADKGYNTGERNKGCTLLGVGYKNADI